ncbi:hypothetical protein [Phyllobacterium salinisoli]|uniref:hypothetical protein n=1 Tax=Phyllobacterium salinisoli TaxID=1899321 RepID=UPI001FDED687|nr:hypothetical protein [Phyllobacterium salinisoli]
MLAVVAFMGFAIWSMRPTPKEEVEQPDSDVIRQYLTKVILDPRFVDPDHLTHHSILSSSILSLLPSL